MKKELKAFENMVHLDLDFQGKEYAHAELNINLEDYYIVEEALRTPLETKSIEFWIYDEPEFGKATRISLEELLDYRKKGYELEMKLIKPAIVKTVGLTIELEDKKEK